MVGSVVFIFLLDHLPDHSQTAIDTRVPFYEYQNHVVRVQQCGVHIADPLVQVAAKELNVFLVPHWRNDETELVNILSNFTSNYEKENDDNAGMDKYAEEDLSSMQYEHFIQDELTSQTIDNNSDCDKPATIYGEDVATIDLIGYGMPANNDFNSSNTSLTHNAAFKLLSNNFKAIEAATTEPAAENVTVKPSFPERVPYLVAIFESLANVTAQTCGGVLVSPQWVLTAPSCVNVLANLYNKPNTTDKPVYTVVANSTNPLLDGSAHNVTRVQFHPLPANGTAGKEKRPALALMRIEPRAEIDEVPIHGGVATGGVDVMIYGWVLVKNESGHDAMRATSFPAATLPPLECRALHGPADGGAICLTVTGQLDNGTDSQMTSGGPVVVLAGGEPQLLALAVSDARAPLLAAPLTAHNRWLQTILHATSDT